MQALRKNWLAILCLGTAFAFFGQTMLCLASDAGLIACEASADHQYRGTAPADTDNCCHCTSHTPLLPASAAARLGAHVGAVIFRPANDTVPDGPVREIEHPPQLS